MILRQQTLSTASAELPSLQDQAVASAKTDTSAPIAYLLSDRDGDGIAETDGLPQTLAAGEALTAHVMVSAIDPDAAGDTSMDFTIFGQEGLTLSNFKAGELLEDGTSLGYNPVTGKVSFFAISSDENVTGTTGKVAQFVITNDGNESIDLSSLTIEDLKIGEVTFIPTLDESAIREEIAEDYFLERGIFEEIVKQSAIEEFDTNTALIQSIEDQAEANYTSLPGNNEISVKQSAAQQFDADTALIESIEYQAEIDYTSLPGTMKPA